MIYTVISTINEMDCRILRQPCLYLPAEVERYILDTKNNKTREERLTAYTLLSASLEKFCGINDWNIEKNAYGKPILVTKGKENNLYINISHSEGVVAVVLSDEGEVGVDLQSEIPPGTEDRLKKRFFAFDIRTADNFTPAYFFFDRECNFTELAINPIEKISFTDKWSLSEAVMKCDGRGFSSLPELEKLQREMDITVKRFSLDKVNYSLSVAKKRVIM